MADTIKLISLGLAKGLQDAILGTLRVYHLDNEAEDSKTASPQKMEPKSTLARRRAERMKGSGKETSVSSKSEEPKVMQRIIMCCIWNGGIFWASIIAFNGLLMPCLRFLTELIFRGSSSSNIVWTWMGPLLNWTFSALWILPLFVLSKVVNGLWFQDIADAAYRKSRGRPNLIPSLSKIIADVLFSLIIQSLFLIQGMLANLLPIRGLGELIGLIHMCLLYSLYAFEYKWFNMGWEVHKRLSYIESQWPYFVGFGLPLALLTSWPSSYIVSGCVFSILFPLFIISANEAAAVSQIYCDVPLRLFSLVINISNAIFHHSVRGSASSGGKINVPQGSMTKSATVR